MVGLSARERQNRDPPATTVADVLEFSYSATGASAKARGAVENANKRLHEAGTGRARSVLRFRLNPFRRAGAGVPIDRHRHRRHALPDRRNRLQIAVGCRAAAA